jgi:hypothetical protein
MRIRLAALVLALIALAAGPGAIAAAAKGVDLSGVPALSPNPPVALPRASVQPQTTTPVGPTQPLPRTGIDARAILGAAGLMLMTGFALQRAVRRRRL